MNISQEQIKEFSHVIRDYYKKEYKYFYSVGHWEEMLSDESQMFGAYRFILFQLQGDLFEKKNAGLSREENDLYNVLINDKEKQNRHVYSDELMDRFKEMMKEITHSSNLV